MRNFFGMRNIVGSLLALIGTAATLISPWQAWYNNRHGSTYKFYEVFGSGITVSKSGIMDSVFLVFLVMTIVTVIGVVMGSRVLVGVAGVISFGFTILWMIRQGQAAGELTITGANNRGLGSGVAWAFGGGLLMIAGALVMTGQPHRAVETETAGAMAADQSRYGAAASTTAAPSAITTTTPADRDRAATTAPPASSTAPPASSTAPATPASERTGTERLSKEEREMLGLDEEAPAPRKEQT